MTATRPRDSSLFFPMWRQPVDFRPRDPACKVSAIPWFRSQIGRDRTILSRDDVAFIDDMWESLTNLPTKLLEGIPGLGVPMTKHAALEFVLHVATEVDPDPGWFTARGDDGRFPHEFTNVHRARLMVASLCTSDFEDDVDEMVTRLVLPLSHMFALIRKFWVDLAQCKDAVEVYQRVSFIPPTSIFLTTPGIIPFRFFPLPLLITMTDFLKKRSVWRYHALTLCRNSITLAQHDFENAAEKDAFVINCAILDDEGICPSSYSDLGDLDETFVSVPYNIERAGVFLAGATMGADVMCLAEALAEHGTLFCPPNLLATSRCLDHMDMLVTRLTSSDARMIWHRVINLARMQFGIERESKPSPWESLHEEAAQITEQKTVFIVSAT